MHAALVSIICALPLVARASEPYRPDVTQRAYPSAEEPVDHLEPVPLAVPEYYYLAQFIAARWAGKSDYLVVLRTKDGRYLMRHGNLSRKETFSSRPAKTPKTNREIEIPESLASVIYDLWVNALFEVRYYRRDYAGFDGETYTFSTFINGLGWMHGTIWSPTADLPPLWMADAGQKLVAFTQDAKRDVKALEAELRAVREKLFRYVETHGKH